MINKGVGRQGSGIVWTSGNKGALKECLAKREKSINKWNMRGIFSLKFSSAKIMSISLLDFKRGQIPSAFGDFLSNSHGGARVSSHGTTT